MIAPRTRTDADIVTLDTEFKRGLGLFDSTMVVAGSMIGSGIYIVSAAMARQLGSPGWLLVAWVITGVLTITAALAYGELAAMMPRAGGQYVYLREAYSPLWGFLYGWTLFMVIQTGTIAAVAVAFARFAGILVPWIAEDRYIVPPLHISTGYAISLSTAQLVGVALIALLTWTNTRGLDYGKVIQNVFTTTKTGVLVGAHPGRGFRRPERGGHRDEFRKLLAAARLRADRRRCIGGNRIRHLRRALCVANGLALLGRRMEQHHLHRRRGEGSTPQRSAFVGIRDDDRHFPLPARERGVPVDASVERHPARACRIASRRSSLEAIFPGTAVALMAVAIMISTFGCNNGLILAGARAYYAMARDGLFFAKAGRLNTRSRAGMGPRAAGDLGGVSRPPTDVHASDPAVPETSTETCSITSSRRRCSFTS